LDSLGQFPSARTVIPKPSSGEKDLATEQVAATLQIPSSLHYGSLRLHPFWDPLRGDSRFEKIVASLAPKSGGEAK